MLFFVLSICLSGISHMAGGGTGLCPDLFPDTNLSPNALPLTVYEILLAIHRSAF